MKTMKNATNPSISLQVAAAPTLLLLLLVVAASWLQALDAAASGLCASKCAVRCGRARGRGGCVRSCGLCCEECSCVPTGPRRDDCPCYRNMLTAGPTKRRKCP